MRQAAFHRQRVRGRDDPEKKFEAGSFQHRITPNRVSDSGKPRRLTFVPREGKALLPNPHKMKIQINDPTRDKAWTVVLILIRLWLAYAMIRNGNSVISIFTSEEERVFFRKWFGDELGFPIPLVMATLAKGSEFLGGICILLGFYTRIAASFVSFTMLVATLTANLGKDFNIDGGFTISYFLFGLVLIVWGSEKFALDSLFHKRKGMSPG